MLGFHSVKFERILLSPYFRFTVDSIVRSRLLSFESIKSVDRNYEQTGCKRRVLRAARFASDAFCERQPSAPQTAAAARFIFPLYFWLIKLSKDFIHIESANIKIFAKNLVVELYAKKV